MKFFLFFFALFFWSCTRDDIVVGHNPIRYANIYFPVVDEYGNDLLAPNHPNGINPDSIRIFFVNGKDREVYEKRDFDGEDKGFFLGNINKRITEI